MIQINVKYINHENKKQKHSKKSESKQKQIIDIQKIPLGVRKIGRIK